MRDQELERLFDRFRRRGDVQALGAIFDATAPELLRVAMSLVRDPGEADDLLQETFLTAIQRAPRYDAERRLVPWLLGILVHHAREERRLRRRELDPARFEPRSASTPEAAARSRELEAELERALAELSERERLVLDAYLRHGKGAAEIAGETGAAPGAVRMQIHRGLDRLRKALPLGIALGTAGAASAQGLAAVRSAVLRAGETAAKSLTLGAGSAVGAGTAGVLMAKKMAVVGVLVALAAGLFLLRSLGEREPVAANDSARVAARTEEPLGSAGGRSTPALADAVAPSAAPETSARVAAAPATDPDRAGLRGRVVEHDGTPAPGLSVALLQLDEIEINPARAEQLGAAPAPHFLVASATTDRDGRFLLLGASIGAPSGLGIDLGGARATLRVLDANLAPGATCDLGDVVLHETGAVSGRVLDEHGRGLAGARVRIGEVPGKLVEFGLTHLAAGGAIVGFEQGEARLVFELPAWISGFESKLPFATTTTAADGRFELPRVASGMLTMMIDAPGYARLVSGAIGLDRENSVALGDQTLERGARVSGRVLDAAGRPVARADVRAGILSRAREVNVFTPIQVADADGRFTVEHLPSGWKLGVLARRDARGAWGMGLERDGEFVVTLPVEQELLVDVVDSAGAAVARPTLFVRAASEFDEVGTFAPPLPPCESRVVDASTGRWSLGRFAPGRYQVVARASGLATASAVADIGASTPPAQRLVLEALRTLAVHVRDAATNTPIAGAIVRVEETQGSPPAVVARALTDESGSAALELPSASEKPLWLHVEHARFAQFLRAVDAKDDVEVALGNGGRLVARLGDPSGARERCMLVLDQRGTKERREFHLPRLVALPSEGELVLEHLALGDWNWSLYPSLFSGEALALIDPDHQLAQFDEGSFTLAEGQTFELALNTADVPPPSHAADTGSLTGIVRVGGKAVANLHAQLVSTDSDGSSPGPSADGTGGRFRFDDVPPGHYQLFVFQTSSETSSQMSRGPGEAMDAEDPATQIPEFRSIVSQAVEIVAGGDPMLTFDVALHVLSVRVLDENRQPVAKAHVSAGSMDSREGWSGGIMGTDSEGRARFELSGIGRHRVLAMHDDQGTAQGEADVDGSELTLVLSKGVECSGTVHLPPSSDGPNWIWIDVRSQPDPYLQTRCKVELAGDSGPFRIVGLRPGTYRATTWSGAHPVSATLEVPESGSSTLELGFAPEPDPPVLRVK